MIRGRVIKYGDNLDTDAIIPARCLFTSDHKELASHCMEDWDKSFKTRVNIGDVMVAGKNFGCGSSREHAPIALKVSGISCVIAENFARIFYRNSVNIGLTIMECPEAARDINDGDEVMVDVNAGVITNITRNKFYSAVPLPPFMQEIMENDGLMNYIKGKVDGK